MPVCVPIKDLKDTAKFAKTVEEAAGPVTVTRNGYDAFVVMRSADYDALLASRDEAARQKLLDRIAIADCEIAEGRYVDGPTALAELKARYGL